jgi:hypothetical protein
MSSIIEKQEKLYNDVAKFVTEALVAKFAELGLDTQTADPAAFGRSMIDKGVRFENFMHPTEPKKDGIYFYKNNIYAGFVHIPREEGVSMIPDLLK